MPRNSTGSYQGTASEVAEKLDSGAVLKGRGFSRAAEALYFCYSERTLVREESASLSFSAACSAVPTLHWRWKRL
jgi:hypothetical protein